MFCIDDNKSDDNVMMEVMIIIMVINDNGYGCDTGNDIRSGKKDCKGNDKPNCYQYYLCHHLYHQYHYNPSYYDKKQ